MSSTHHRLRRRLASLVGAGALAAGTLAVVATPASAAETVDDATFTWGVSGYAQDGIFGPWIFSDFTGDASYLAGNVGSAPNASPQTEYAVDPVPATSFPTSKAGKAPNAVKFTGGDGTVDRGTGAATLAWTGSYTVNAYPPQFGAPDEIYSDPQLEVAADGSGELTMDFTIGAGQSMTGEPFPEKDFGRLSIATFDAGSLSARSFTGYRVTPDYQDVTWDAPSNVTAQTRSCSTQDGATGWWGAWPTDFLDALASHESGTSVVAHFYSTGCAGKQDNKPQLPFDVTFPADTPTVTVSDAEVVRGGVTTLTVKGTGFDPTLATGTRPPFAGQKSGVYVAFGRYADVWRPSASAPSSARKNADSGDPSAPAVVWAVPEASFAASSPRQDPTAPTYTILRTDGSFEAKIPVDETWLKDAPGTFGIYTYAGGGAAVASYETATPLTFVDPEATVVRSTTVKPTFTTDGSVKVVVNGSGATRPTGTVTASFTKGSTVLTSDATDLEDGTATVTIPQVSQAGLYRLSVAYSGDSLHAATTGAETDLSVGTYPATVGRTFTARPTTTSTGAVTTRVTSKSPAKPTGVVRAYMRKGSKQIYGPQATIKADGTAALVLPKATSTGTWRYWVRYSGDKNHRVHISTQSVVGIQR